MWRLLGDQLRSWQDAFLCKSLLHHAYHRGNYLHEVTTRKCSEFYTGCILKADLWKYDCAGKHGWDVARLVSWRLLLLP